MTSLNDTPTANRPHIGFFGKRNSGKSSLINALAGQEVSIVSDVAGTTTDPVFKAIELHGLGASVLIDTAGFDDIGSLGDIRVEKTKKIADRTDIAVILFPDCNMEQELRWCRHFHDHGTPVIPVISKADVNQISEAFAGSVKKETGQPPVIVSAVTGEGVGELRTQIVEALSEDHAPHSILGDMVSDGDTVLLVMPQDIQAPTGRLILPQVQTLRELLDRKCLVISATTDKLEDALNMMKAPPALIITDSQVFDAVYSKKPTASRLTSFSLLFAAYKGDLRYYLEGAGQIDALTERSKVLIAECCTHAPLSEDIGRVKIPGLLRKKIGAGITVEVVSGTDFPENLSEYDLVIQCGGCMFNRKHIMNRIKKAKAKEVPMTNYGVVLAHLSGILDKVSYPSV